MKIKFTLERSEGAVDLVATVDSATSVADVAEYLLAADPVRQDRRPVPGDPTLTVRTANGQITLDPRLPVADSLLRSGSVVTIGRGGTAYVDPQRDAVAMVRIIEGPDTGKEFPIGAGSSIVGRERGCDVRLTDGLVSRRHARINVTESIEVIDLGSANGVQIDEQAVARSVLRPADVVRIGDTALSVRRIAHLSEAREAAGVQFVRSPRLDIPYTGARFEAPEPPERARAQRFPFIPMLAPLLLGGLLYLITRSLTSIVFVALSPIMLIGSAVEGRISGRGDYKRALKDFWSDVDALTSELEQAAVIERTARDAEHPATARCVDAVRTTSALLWTRRPGLRGFAELRLGTASLPSRTTVKVPTGRRSTRSLMSELAGRLEPFARVDGAPVAAPLAEAALGVAGPRATALPVARALMTQLAALHSPAEVVIAAVASSVTGADWDWLKWLPHSAAPSSPLARRQLCSSQAAGTALISEIEELLENRQADEREALPAVVLLVEADAPVEHSRLAALAQHGPAYGVHVVWLAEEVTDLPAACSTYVDVGRDGITGTVGYVHTDNAVEAVTLEQLGVDAAMATARAMAPLVDVDARVDDASDLPRSVSLLALTGSELASSPEAVLERWTENRSVVTGPLAPRTPPRHAGNLRAVIGQSASEVHALDLRVDGPHALVGGTTGAGKSELLQAWILALAAAHSPQRLTFLLVDYKGGSAFRDCVELPHTVGLVTDLSQHLVRRALTSLSAELRYREHLLAKHAAKDLVTLERQGVVEAPPSLIIVVDEFAALVSEVPEFVDGVVNVAQRGRSLGLHLILATQRPAGVIKDNLRANTNLRLALRTADESDSVDVLGSPEAAFFDPGLPGRAVSKTGPGRLVPFQTAYAGGWTSEEPPGPDILVEELSLGQPVVWRVPESDEIAVDDPGPTDIRRIVASIRSASALAEIPQPRKPWLPELAAVYDLADQRQVRSRRSDTELVFGIRDDPHDQTQPTVAFHPDRDGNLAVHGTGGSGKSTLLRSLAIAAGFTVRGGPCHVYGIDFGARGLGMLDDLPHVGSVISGGDHERITRLLSWLRELIDDRALRYSRANAGTITDYRRLTGHADEPRILLLVDGIAAFRQAYEASDRIRWFDLFTSIAADGRPVGVHVVLSSDQRGGMPTALSSAVQSRVVLRMSAAEDYGFLGVPNDVLTATSPPGRGVLAGAEIQVAVLGGTSDIVRQSTALRSFAESMRRNGSNEAPPVRALPEVVTLDSLPSTTSDALPVLGMASSTLEPIGFVPSGSMIVCGPPGSGRTTTLQALCRSLRRWRPDVELYYFGSARSVLAQETFWTRRVVTASEAGDGASDITALLSARSGSGRPAAVVVEGIGEFANSMAEQALQQLLKQCVVDGHLYVAEGETSTFVSGMGLIGQVKVGRAGLSLMPDPGDGPTIFKTAFPKLNPAELPPGRALLVRQGRTEVVQIGLPSAT